MRDPGMRVSVSAAHSPPATQGMTHCAVASSACLVHAAVQHPHRMHAGITSTAVMVAVFAIIAVGCLAFHRLRRERRERERFQKLTYSYPIRGPSHVISDHSSNAFWVRSQSTTGGGGGRQSSMHSLGEPQATPLAAGRLSISGPLPLSAHPGGSMQRGTSHESFSSGGHDSRARPHDTSQHPALWTQPAENVRVWTPPTRGHLEVTATAPSTGGMWGAPHRTSVSMLTAARTAGHASAPKRTRDGTTLGTRDGSLPSAWTPLALTENSPPVEFLEAQLEWLSHHQGGRLLEYLQCAPPDPHFMLHLTVPPPLPPSLHG